MRVHPYGDPRMTVPMGVCSFRGTLVRALIFGCLKREISDYCLLILALMLLIM